jgi:hypothetical protein
MHTILQTRERLLDRLSRYRQAGELDAAAVLEFGIAEFDGVIALLTHMTERARATMH